MTSELDEKKLNSQYNVKFVRVNGTSEYFPIVKHAFKKILEPIYGNQKAAIRKIESDKDRYCELMFKGNNPLGILIYKRELQCEYGLRDGLELKTLFLLAPEKNSGKGFGSLLYKRIEEVARNMKTDIIFCTASEKSQKSMKCALKNGFQIIRFLNDLNSKNQEYLLVKNIG